MIALLIDSLRSFRLAERDFVIRLSSRNAWHDFFVQGNGDLAKEYEFYQVVDKLDRQETDQSDQKLRALGFSLAAVNEFIETGRPTVELQRILDNLTARGLHNFVKMDYRVIRGLAYYTGTVFEAFDCRGELRAIAGGGRYDNLVKLISGGKVDLPALGFGMGDVVLRELLRARGLLPKFDSGVEAFCLIENETLRDQSLKLVQDLRDAGLIIEYSLTAAKADKQFKRAQELKAAWTVKLERADDGAVTVKIKHLQTREERSVNPADVASQLRAAKVPVV